MISLFMMMAFNWQVLTVVEYGPATPESLEDAVELVAERGTRNRLVMTKVCGWREIAKQKEVTP